MRRMLQRQCELCGSSFLYRPEHEGRARFCSMSCRSKTVARSNAAARGDAQRDRGEGRTYRKRNGRHEHRLVAEQTLGRPLKAGEIVHHIDGNIRNNDPSNLQVMTQAEHMRAHGLGVPGMTLPWKPWEHRR